VLSFCVWWGVLFNQFVICIKFCVHFWTIIIGDFCCYTLTLILNGHHVCIFSFHGINFKCIVNVFIFRFFCVWCGIYLKQCFDPWKLYVYIFIQLWSMNFLYLNLNPWWQPCVCFFFFMSLNYLELLVILLLYEQQLWIHKHYCDWWIGSCCV